MVTPDICSCIVVALTGVGRCHVEAPKLFDKDISKLLDYFEDATISNLNLFEFFELLFNFSI
jgi:hypothetical protein